ncbi:IQ domain-containing protein N [Equus asinus]|uniref:IQ domain-containing protein N n=1 Tax=Equus asinus TaxID=9793 RepID=UPI0038F66145
MKQATQLQLSPNGQSCYQLQLVPSLQDKAGTSYPQPQQELPLSRETLLPQLDKDKTAPHRMPRLRAVVESQAFKNVLVDEMDMMLSRAATLIQANWRGYRLRQKLISQMTAAKAIQEAWRRFSTRRLLRSGKMVEKKVNLEEGDIPYHPPQQVRFQPLEEAKSLPAQPVMVSRETQFPSSDSLAACAHQLALLQSQGTPQPDVQAPGVTGGPGITFLPQQTITIRLPCPVSPDAKSQPCLMTRTVRSTCLVHHVEGDMMKTKQVISRANKAGASGPPFGKCAQAAHGPLKTQPQTPAEAEVLRAPAQRGPVPVMTKTPPQPCPAATMTKTPPQPCPAATMTKTPPQPCPAATMTKTPPQPFPAAMMTKTPPQPFPAATMTKTPPQPYPAATMTKTPPQPYPAATMTKTPPQPCPAAAMTKTPPQPCPAATMTKTPPQPCTVPTVTITKTPPQMYLAAPMTKTPPQTYPAAPLTKTPPQMSPAATMTKTPPQISPAATMTKTPLQSCLAAMINKTLLQMYPAAMMTKTSPQPCPVPTVTITKTPTQVYPVAPMTKIPPQTYPRGVMTKIPPQPGPAAPMTKTPAQMQPTASMTNTSPQTRPVAMMTKTPPQTCPMASMIKPPTQTRPAAMITKTPPQMYPMDTMTKTPLQTCPAVAKTPSQMLSGAAVTKTPPQTRLTAMITKTPAQLRSVAAILKTLCLPPPAAPPPAGVAAAIPNTSSHASLDGAKARAVANTRQAAGMVKVSSHSYLTEGKVKCFPPPALGAVAPKAPARPPLEAEKIKAFPQKQGKTETARNTSAAAEMPRAPSWAKVAEDGSKAHLRMDIRKVQSQVYVPVEMAVALPQAQVATRVSTASCQTYPPAKLTKAQSLAHLDTCLTKVQAQARPANGAVKVQSQVHLPAGLSTAPSQAQMVSETAKCFHAAHQPAELSSKTQSQPLLAGFKASTQPCQHVGTLGTLPRAKLEDRLTQLPPHSCAQGKATQGPRQGAFETQSLPVPLLASAGHSTCNVESWGDSVAARAQPSLASPAIPCQEELAASQLASLCAELAALLGSQEDIRALLARALSQGEARAALNQALSSDVLGSTVAKALSPGMLGTALVKVLSWSKLDIALSHTMSWGELQAKLTKATQGKVVDALSKALTEEEHAALSQALCQGELGAILSQPLSQAALRTGAGLPKAATKMMRSGMTVMPSPMEVDRRESPVATCGPILSPGRPQPSKVRVLSAGVWEGFVTGWPTRLLEGMGDGAGIMGSPCSSVVSVGASLTRRVITTIYQHPLAAALDPTLSREMGPSRDSSLQLYLNLEVSEENVCPHPVVLELASDLNPVANDTGPNLPRSPHLQPPPSVWQPLIANGVGPSTSQPSVASGTALSSHNPHVVSRVASRPWASSGQGRVAPGQFLSTVGNGRANQSHQCATAHGGSACWCQSSGVGRVPPSVYRPSMAKGPQQPSMVPEEDMQRTQSPNHKRASLGTRDVINKVTSSPQRAATVSKVSSTQPRTHKACDVIPLLLPGSVAPARRQAPKTQADASPSQASPGSPLASHLLHMATSGQERNRMQATVSSMHCPQGLLMGPTLRKLVASLPQGSDDDLARSFSQGSTDYSPNMSDSQSSLCTCSLHSMSASSVASLTSVHLVEEESWEASSHKDLLLDGSLSGEAMERPLELEDVEETEIVGHRHMIPNLHQQSPAASEPTPTLYHSSVSSHMTLGVHWGSDGQDDRDMSLGQSSMGPKESLSQKPDRTGLTRSLSSGNVVPTIYQQPSVARRLTPSLLQPSVASKVAPTPGQPSLASGVTLSLSNSSKANGVAPTLGRTSITSRAAPSLGQPSRTSGVAPTLGRTSMISGVAPRLAQPSVTSGVAPSLGRTSMTSGVVPRLAQPSMTSSMAPSLGRTSMTSGVAPRLAQASVTSGVASRLAQPSVTSGVALSLGRTSMTSGVAPSLAQPSMTCGVAPRLAQPSVTSGVAPSLAQPSVTSGVAPTLGRTSMTSGVAPRLAQPSVTSGVAPSLAQPSVTSRVAPSLAQPSVTSGVAPTLGRTSMTSGVAPSLAQPSVTSGVAPSLAQPSVTSGVALSLGRTSMTSGVAPRLAQPSVTSGVAPSLAQPSVTSGVAPSLTQPSVTSGVAPSLAQPSVTSGVAPSLAQPSVTSGVALSLGRTSMTSGVAPRLAQPSVTSGVAPSLAQPSVTSGVAPSLAQPSVTSGVAPTLGRTSMTSGVAPSQPQPSVTSGLAPRLAQPSVTSGVAPSLTQPSVTSGVAPSLAQPSMTCGVAPRLAQPSVTSEVAPSLAQPSMTCGVAPRLAQPSVTSGVALSLGRTSMTSGVAPRLAQPSVTSGVAPSLAQPSVTSRVVPSLAQPSVTSGVAPSLAQPSVTSGVAPTLDRTSMTSGVAPSQPQPSVTSGLAPRLAQPSVTSGVAPSLAQLSMTCGAAPSLAQPLMTSGVAPSLAQPSVTSGVAPSLAQPSVTSGVAPRLGQPSVATLLAFRGSQPPVISGKGGALSQPSWAPGVSSNALSSRVNAVAPSPCHSSFVSEVTSSAPYPCVTSSMGQALSQPFVAPGLGPCQDPLTARGEAPHLWAPEFCEVSLGFCQPLSVGGRCPTVTEHPSAAPSAPVLHQACMARGEDSDSGQASSVCQGIVFRDMAACIPQGAVAAGMFPRMAPGTLAAGMFLSVSQGPMCPGMTGSMCQRRVMTGMSPDQSQVVSGTAPMAAPAAVADAPLGHEQASEVGPGCSLASLLCGLAMSPSKSLASGGPGTSQGHVDLPTSLDHQCPPVPTVAASGYQQVYDFSWEPGMGIASGLAPCSVASRMTTAVTLGTVVSGVAPSLLPGYTVNGVVQPLPPGAMVSGMIRTLPLASVASGASPSLSVAPEAGGKRRDLPGGPSASLTALSLPQGSEASAPPGSVASSAVPASMVGGLNQGLALGPMASAACLPSAAGSMAPSLLQGSMLVETTPQLYQEALAGEGSTVPFQASHATSLAQVHPQASEAGGPARGVHQVPTVLQRASQLHQALGVAPSETTDGQAMMKPQDLYEAVSQVSVSSEQSVVLEDTPWMGDSPLATEIDHGREFLVEDGTLPNGQRPLLEEVVPSQAKSMTSGMAPVPPQPSSFAKHSIGGSVTPILQQPISWGAPSSHFVAASRVPSVQMGSVKGTGAPLAHQQSSVAHIIPQSHSYGIQASPTVSGSPKPACGSTVASSLHLGSVAGMGTPSTSRSGAFSVASAVPPYPSMASRAASGGLQMEAVPSAPRKPVSGDVAQNSHHGFLSSRKSYRSVHGKLVSEMPDDSLAKIVQEQAFRSAQEGPKYSTGPPLAPPPIIRTGQVAHNAAAPRLHLGRRRVSLGYESSPSGSRRPLCSHESLLGSQDFHSAVAPVDSHRASLTPAVLQGPMEAGVAGGQVWNSAVPSVAAGPMNSAAAPGGVWEPARATVPWDAVGSQVVADPRQSGELVVSVQDMEKIISQAVVTIQACARGYLVRRTIRVWHQWAIVIQAAWRGYRVRQELARLSRAAIVIQATWRGFCTRRGRAQQTLQPGTWAEMGGGTRTTSDHRCFQSCQPHVCALCQSLSPGLGSPPSVVMLVGSSPRTCHMCGQSLPTRVVHGTGQGSSSQAGTPWDCASQPVTPSLQQSHLQNKAATTIQSGWRGFLVRRRLRQQQGAAKMLQATWRGHSARSSLTTDALLGPAAWDNPQHTQWPGV